MINPNYQNNLLEEKATLEKELSEIAILNTETNTWEAVPDNEMMGEIDDNDVADRFEDFEERASMVTALQKKLSSVELALKNIKDGTYGKCEVCGKEIEKDRLDVNPSARTCKEHINQ